MGRRAMDRWAAAAAARVIREAVDAAKTATVRQQVACAGVLENEDLLCRILIHVLWFGIRDDDFPFARLTRMAFVARAWFEPVARIMACRHVTREDGVFQTKCLISEDRVLKSLHYVQPVEHCEHFDFMYNRSPIDESRYLGGPENEKEMSFECNGLCIGPSWIVPGPKRYIQAKGIDLGVFTPESHFAIFNKQDTVLNHLLVMDCCRGADEIVCYVGSCSLAWRGPAQFVRVAGPQHRPELVPINSRCGWVALVCDVDSYDTSIEADLDSETIFVNTQTGLRYVVGECRIYSMIIKDETPDTITVWALGEHGLWTLTIDPECLNRAPCPEDQTDLIHLNPDDLYLAPIYTPDHMNRHGCICRDGAVVCHVADKEWLRVWRDEAEPWDRVERQLIQFPTPELREAANYSECTTISETAVSGVVIVELDHHRAHYSVVVNLLTGKVLNYREQHRRRPPPPNMFDCGEF